MGTVVDFKKALSAKADEQHALRQIIPNDFVKKALAAGRAEVEAKEKDDRINQAIYDFEVARAKWRCAKNV